MYRFVFRYKQKLFKNQKNKLSKEDERRINVMLHIFFFFFSIYFGINCPLLALLSADMKRERISLLALKPKEHLKGKRKTKRKKKKKNEAMIELISEKF